MLCPVLSTLQVAAFLGDLTEKRHLVLKYNSLHLSVQQLWTAPSHASYVRKFEPWLPASCPTFNDHSLSTLHESQVETNHTYLSRYLSRLPGRPSEAPWLLVAVAQN